MPHVQPHTDGQLHHVWGQHLPAVRCLFRLVPAAGASTPDLSDCGVGGGGGEGQVGVGPTTATLRWSWPGEVMISQAPGQSICFRTIYFEKAQVVSAAS